MKKKKLLVLTILVATGFCISFSTGLAATKKIKPVKKKNSSLLFASNGAAQSALFYNSGTGSKGPLLANKVAGKLMLKADLGGVYIFGGKWTKSGSMLSINDGDNQSSGANAIGYGASLGWTSKINFGLSADYLGFEHKWIGAGAGQNGASNYNYDVKHNIITFVPSYRIRLDSSDRWGLRLGLGLGFDISDMKWAKNLTSGGTQANGLKVAGGAIYRPVDINVDNKFNTNSCIVTAISDSEGHDFSNGHPNSLSASVSGLWVSPGDCSAPATDADIVSYLEQSGAPFENASGASPAAIEYFSGTVAYNVWKQILAVDNNATGARALRNAMSFQSGAGGAGGAMGSVGGNGSGVIAPVTINDLIWSELSYATQSALKATGLVTNNITIVYANATSSGDGATNNRLGFIIAPQASVEFDNGMLHADINIKYLHELLDVNYFGSEGSVDATESSGAITYTNKAGPLALFIGAGIGINF
ncbi:MAG: hypothetical protein QM529_04615 [Hydrotalea sp.]|nr:hypothetical protein [Hydrotalea sp.]